jgi:uncharacterized repeat protein (TIGR04076 family)
VVAKLKPINIYPQVDYNFKYETQSGGSMLQIKVCQIKGKCPVYKVGDKMTIEGAKILLDKTDAICMHALSTLLHYVVALDEGADPVKLGLSKDKERAYMQCVDPGEPYTEGGTVIFECYRIGDKDTQ